MQLSHISFNRKHMKLKHGYPLAPPTTACVRNSTRKAAKLSARERVLGPTKDHLAVIALIDVRSGVPNRRVGSRLDFRMGGSPATRAMRSNGLMWGARG
jgi:hypothetical protein